MKRTTEPKKIGKPPKKVKRRRAIQEDVQYSKYQLKKILNKKQIKFCHFYIRQYLGTDSYIKAYGTGVKRRTASSRASKLIATNTIQQYISHIEKDIAQEVGISKIDFLHDLKHIAKADLGDMFNDDWISRKALNEIKRINPFITKALQEVNTKIVHKQDPLTKEPFHEEYVHIKLKDGLKATDMIFKAMNWYAPEQIEVKTETQVNIDITKYNEEEKKMLLKMARKTEIL